jgi:class 3 adenylate cyclase
MTSDGVVRRREIPADEYSKEMTATVPGHGGTLDNFVGDGIMPIFGPPPGGNLVSELE